MKRIISILLVLTLLCALGCVPAWAAETVTITFRGNGGTTAEGLTMTTQQTTAGTSTRLDNNPFTREGYRFTGWSTSAASSAGIYANGQAVGVTQDTTLYAIWQINVYDLTVCGIEGFAGGEVEYGTDLSLLLPANPQREGYRFTGWTAVNAAGETVPMPQTMPAYDLTITAGWEERGATYILTLLDEQGEVMATYSYAQGAAIEEPVLTWPEGMRLRGWRNAASGRIQELPQVMPACDLEFLAVLEEIYYTVTFMDGNAEVGEVTAYYGEKAMLIDRPAQTGKVFLGWSRDPAAATAQFGAWEEIDLTEDMTVYAVWGTPDPGISLKYPTLTFEDVIVMNVYYCAEDLSNVAEMGLVTFSQKVDNPSIDTALTVVPGYTWSDNDQLYYSSTEGIAAKNLGDTIHFALYYRLTDGTYGYTKVNSYSPKTYAMNVLSGNNEPGMKTLVVAMLNYGAAAQTYFKYNTDNLVNNSLTDAQKGMVEAYREDMIAAVTKATGDKPGDMVNTGGYVRCYPTISFEGAFCINYYFLPSAAVEGDVTMYVWTLEDFNAVDALSKDNATKAITVEKTASGEYTAVVDGIAAKDLDKAVYISFCYSDGTTDYCNGVTGYTIGLYCKTQAAGTGTMASLASSCAVYGYYAKELFYEKI